MTVCDLCGETKECLLREIEGREYDICSECWNPLAERLKGKGRVKNWRTVFLPPRPSKEDEAPEDPPDTMPKIWGAGSTLKH